MSRGSREADAF